MEKYDKDVVARRFRARRKARKGADPGSDKLLNFFFLFFALGAVILLAVLALLFFR